MYLAEIFHEFKQRYASGIRQVQRTLQPSAMLQSSRLKTGKAEKNAYSRLPLRDAEEEMSLDTAACRAQKQKSKENAYVKRF